MGSVIISAGRKQRIFCCGGFRAGGRGWAYHLRDEFLEKNEGDPINEAREERVLGKPDRSVQSDKDGRCLQRLFRR